MRYCRRRRKHGAETAVDGVGDVQTRWCIAHCLVACEVTFLFGVGEGREVGSGRAAARGSCLRLNACPVPAWLLCVPALGLGAASATTLRRCSPTTSSGLPLHMSVPAQMQGVQPPHFGSRRGFFAHRMRRCNVPCSLRSCVPRLFRDPSSVSRCRRPSKSPINQCFNPSLFPWSRF